MSKIHRITVSNLKAVASQTATFEGCTAIITGGNNKGKTSFLRSLQDRIRAIKPEIVLKHGEAEGFAELELTTQEKFRWEFKENKEKLIFITDKAIKTPATRAICDQYFPAIFDVDKFLAAQPRFQRKMLQELVGIDFTEIDSRYKIAYDKREGFNRVEYEARIRFQGMPVPEKVEPVDESKLLSEKEEIRNRLNARYLKNKADNDAIMNQWLIDCERIRKEVEQHNTLMSGYRVDINRLQDAMHVFISLGYEGKELLDFIKSYEKKLQDYKKLELPEKPDLLDPKPSDKELRDKEDEITKAREWNVKVAKYQEWLTHKENLQKDKEAAMKADEEVRKIEAERLQMIQSAKMPEGFSFNEEGILYNGLPFTREQQSSSGLYIAALKLAAMTLGEVKTLHFDASFLDRNNLQEIEAWAEKEGLQLLIERPDFEGGEITYEIIHNHGTDIS